MKIKQLSIFLENKTGRINEVTKILSHAGINMQAFSMAETTDFGILRLIVAEVDKAVEVLCIKCRNEAGALSTILDRLSEQNIFIEYMYAFAEDDRANVVIRPSDIERCIEILSQCQCDVINNF